MPAGRPLPLAGIRVDLSGAVPAPSAPERGARRRIVAAGSRLRFPGSELAVRRPRPRRGEHDEEVPRR